MLLALCLVILLLLPLFDEDTTPYSVLGVTVTSSREEIFQAYVKGLHETCRNRFHCVLVSVLFPRVNRIHYSYQILTDPLQRCLYHKFTGMADWYGVPQGCGLENFIKDMKNETLILQVLDAFPKSIRFLGSG